MLKHSATGFSRCVLTGKPVNCVGFWASTPGIEDPRCTCWATGDHDQKTDKWSLSLPDLHTFVLSFLVHVKGSFAPPAAHHKWSRSPSWAQEYFPRSRRTRRGGVGTPPQRRCSPATTRSLWTGWPATGGTCASGGISWEHSGSRRSNSYLFSSFFSFGHSPPPTRPEGIRVYS